MNRRDWLLWACLGLATAGIAAVWVDTPGYMDAQYYMSTARQVAEGHGLSQPFVWNYLDDPQGLPHPSHQYWMPLTSLVAAAPMLLFGSAFRVAQIPFLLLTALLPILTAWLAQHYGGTRRHVFTAGGLAAASGFFLPFFVTTDSFALYAVIGTGIFLAAEWAARAADPWRWLVLGGLIALAHLTRADGPLFFAAAGWALWRARQARLSGAALLILGYLALMGPWMLRSLAVGGSLLPNAGARTLWLQGYDDLFRYPADSLSFASLAGAGLGQVLRSRLSALMSILVSLWVVNGLVILAPLAAWAAWRRRERVSIAAAGLYWSALIVVMSFLFPFSGARGGYFHSSAALMPLLWALTPQGLDDLISWAAARRSWELPSARRAFSLGALLIAAAATLYLLAVRLVLPAARGAGWSAAQRDYARVGQLLQAEPDAVIAVNNPPGYWLATGQRAVVIPAGGEQALLRVVQDFDVAAIVLEANHPEGLDPLYADPGQLDWAQPVGSLAAFDGRPIWLLQVEQGGEGG